jgi:hypothetical protein
MLMNFTASGIALLWLASSLSSLAQLTIDNPLHLNLPEDQARLLLQLSYRKVARELHLSDSSNIESGLHLVLGEKEERYGYDDHSGVATVFLREWNETKFVIAAMRFAVQHSIGPQRQEQMVVEVLRRAKQIAPVPAAQIRGHFPQRSSEPVGAGADCLKGVQDASIRDIRCDPSPTLPPR